MSDQKEVFEYDEDASVAFIQNHLPEEMKSVFSTDDINYIVDLIHEFYEVKGFFNENDDSEIEIDEAQLLEYVIKNVRKDKIVKLSDEQIEAIIDGELAYCDSLNIFE